jgi:patatin-related protein
MDGVNAPFRTDSVFVAKEYRFSVVMYGGVSLAIYMNGVAQELLHMVRSTARNIQDDGSETQFRFRNASADGLKSTEKVYRDLARELNNEGVDDVRFIIDVISGTSAGGINGIFLAKALTDDSLNFDVLQNLWVEEGALELLLNDKRTADKTEIPNPDPPRSLLCSDRMYIKLLYALQQMRAAGKAGQPYIKELDLFVTTTDISGRVVPLRLADRLVWERKYREDFQFSFKAQESGDAAAVGDDPNASGGNGLPGSPEYNDFEDQNNPFIAFVARCTSSFPFAFEPMQLRKIQELQNTKAWKDNPKISEKQLTDWENQFFDKTAQLSDGTNRTRAFGDGGYLNNKPFSYVIDMLGRHSSTLPAERKLVYVEPSPEHPEWAASVNNKDNNSKGGAPNALINSYDALIKLPAYQPIHDDLQRVIERNRLVRKVIELSSAVTSTITATARAGQKKCELSPESAGDFGYVVLRAYAATDDLSKVLSEWFDLPTSSSFYYGIRCLVRAWREANYDNRSGNRAVGEALFRRYREFLEAYDIEYELRKYKFVRQQINIFYCFDTAAQKRLENDFGLKVGSGDKNDFQQALIRLKTPFDIAHRTVRDASGRIRPCHGSESASEVDTTVAAAFQSLKTASERFESNRHGKSIVEYVLGIESQGGNASFAPATADQDENYIQRAREILPELQSQVKAVASAISDITRGAAIRSKELVESQLSSFHPQSAGQDAAKTIIACFYRNFELFDTALFPLIYDTDVGTPELISVIRVSPDDATRLFDQGQNPGYQKLAGVSLGHFGAFLDRSFRTNDILWGRLDGAERIIRCLLPTDEHKTAADKLIDQAQLIIIREFLQQRQTELAGVIFEVAKSLGIKGYGISSPFATGSPTSQLSDKDMDRIRKCVAESLDALPNQNIKQAVLGFFSPEAIKECLKQRPLRREPDSRATAESITRAVGVVGGMLEGLGKETGPAGGLLIRVSTLLWWLVEAAVPKGLRGHFFRRLFALLFLFEILMVVGGTFLDQGAQSLGLKLLAITTAAWLIKDALQRFIEKGMRGVRITLLLTILAGLGGSAVWLVRDRYGPVVPAATTIHWLRSGVSYIRNKAGFK